MVLVAMGWNQLNLETEYLRMIEGTIQSSPYKGSRASESQDLVYIQGFMCLKIFAQSIPHVHTLDIRIDTRTGIFRPLIRLRTHTRHRHTDGIDGDLNLGLHGPKYP